MAPASKDVRTLGCKDATSRLGLTGTSWFRRRSWRAGSTSRCPSGGVQTKTLEIDGPGIIVVEGVFLFKASNPAPFDLTIWVDCGFGDALKRITKRPEDIQRYGTAVAAKDV